MALQLIPGEGMWFPSPMWNPSGGIPAYAAPVMDATGEKIAFCGRVFNKDRATKTINKVHFRFGTVTKAGGSGLRVSLQDVSTTTLPIQPDESQDQYRDVANGEASFASNMWYTSGLVTSDGTDTGSKRTVAFNEALAVVIEFDASGRQGADSVVVNGLTQALNNHNCQTILKTASWGVQSAAPVVILEFSDGTFGTLTGAYPASALGNVAFKQDTAGADEYAMEFSMPFPCNIDGAWVLVSTTAATTDFDIVLYDGTTAMTNGTVSFEAAHSGTANARYLMIGFPDQVSLAANTTYRLAVKPTQTASNATLYYVDVASADHFQAWPGGTSFALTSRLNEGSWAAVTATRRPICGLRISAFDDGAGGGGTTNIFNITE